MEDTPEDLSLKWQEFEKFHVIRRLRELVGRLWGVQINFTDAKGLLRGVPQGKFFSPINPICQGITTDQKGFQGCMATVRKTTVEANSHRKLKVATCHAGFSTLSLAIIHNGKFLGCVFGDGFVLKETETEQKLRIRNFLTNQFSGEKNLDQFIDEMPSLSAKDLEYLGEFIKVVVNEITSMQADLLQVKAEVNLLHDSLRDRCKYNQMVGKSEVMQQLYRVIERVCDSTSLVLIQGENGTGKELIAKALHYGSKRQKNRFLVVNCGAFNENLLESELFGHVKGSFTGAVKDKVGLFEAANSGTLFLDEIGDTSPTMQVKLLRVLQEGSYTPVGSTQVKKSTARVVAATNRNLQEMVKAGQFREDLYYRLNVINLRVPSLRERREDISLLIDYFLQRFAKNNDLPMKTISSECYKILLNYDWPGNVRELENEIERLCVLAGQEKELTADFLSERLMSYSNQKFQGLRVEGKLKDALEELEKEMIIDGLKRNRWNKTKLAKELGISRAGLIMKVEKYGLDKRSVG